VRSASELPDLSGTTVVVTGGSGGIGAAVCARFSTAGAAVVVGYHQGADRAAAVVAGLPGPAVAVPADVSGPDGCAGLFDAAVTAFGRVDAVVAAAGIQPVEPLDGMSAARWQAVLDADATATFATVQAAAAVLTPGGSVTIVASVEGSRPAPGHAHYASAKAATIMFARAAALEYGPRMRVNTVSPGLVARPALERDWPDGVRSWCAAAPLGELVEAAAVGDACVFLASPMARAITGHDLVVDAGMATVPAW
jgi:NAD(P)-dependent dehydrogenase (short-subunit alcohol dehydrogenase family)